MTVKELRAKLFEVKNQDANVYFSDKDVAYSVEEMKIVKLGKYEIAILGVDLSEKQD